MRYSIEELVICISFLLKISVEKMEFFGFIKSICSNNKRKNAGETATDDVNIQNVYLLSVLIIAREKEKEKKDIKIHLGGQKRKANKHLISRSLYRIHCTRKE